MRKKLISIMLFAIIAVVADTFFVNLKNVQAKPPYLASCAYDEQGRLLSYTCDYIFSSGGCGAGSC